MKLKHKLIKEFQYLGDDKKIIVLKVGTILEEYVYKLKSEVIPIDKDIVDNNTDFFEMINWQSELLSFLKVNKIPQPSMLSKKLYPFIEKLILDLPIKNENSFIEESEKKVLDKINKEIELESNLSDKEKKLLEFEKYLNKKETELVNKIKEFKIWEIELNKLNDENNTWESQHWKFQRNNKHTSCI